MSRLHFRVLSTLSIFIFCNTITFGQTTLPQIFSDHMVLQRDMDIPVWGKSEPGTIVKVALENNSTSTIVDSEGNWMVHLPKMKAGGPFNLEIYTNNNPEPTQRYKDILIGDVWLASGQSNMEWHVNQSMNADEEIKNADHPQIRLFKVTHDKRIDVRNDILSSSWEVCNAQSVKEFSAAAYFFARDLQPEIDVPIGIIQATWGGTPVEAWTSREQLLSSPITHQKILDHDTLTPGHFVKDSLDLIRFWEIVYNPQNQVDKTIPQPDYNDNEWPTLKMPKTFKDWDMPFYEGMVWFRKSIDIPKSMLGKDLTLHLGHPEMNYSIYINGAQICKNIWNANLTHHYTIPDSLIKKGDNILAVRMAVLWGGGGFNPPADSMYVTDGDSQISIAGEWKYQKDLESKIPKINNYHQYPTFLYNAMINPIIPYGLKGFIWYQGEDNVENAIEYRELFPAMITDWRIRWKQGYLPFIYVQLANFMKTYPEPSESDWALLREAQTLTLSQPNTGMACIIDKGETESIHPLNKQVVGERLSLAAQKLVYDKPVQASGPIYKSHKIEGTIIIIDFDEVGSGLSVSNDDPLTGFAIAGADRKFYWAQAKIEGNSVIVSANKVENPVAVRYAWADNPVCNLINKEGLPAVPFRTDNWSAEKSE